MSFHVLRWPATAFALAVAISGGSGLAAASNHFMSGQQLYNICTSNMGGKGHPLEAGECLGYIVGISDTFDCVEANHGKHWNAHKAENSDIVLVTAVLQWLDANPKAMKEQAHRAVGAALEHSFPCK